MPKYKKYAMLICSIGLMLLLVGTTYSFFNYTRTGNPNNFSVGRISFVTNQSSTINLSNIFPIDSANVNTDTDNVGTVVVTITGDTDLDKGIEYLVSSQDTNIYTSSGKQVPLSLNITTTGLGTSNSNYYTERENTNESIYKKLVGDELVGDQMFLVGYIVPNDPLGTPDGIDGSITIKAYFDKNKILISDTPEESASIAGNRTILSTSEWDSFNSNGVSFKVKVEANEGIWVNGSLEDIMQRSAVMDNIQSTYVSASTGIDFGAISSDTNGKGVYTRAGTESDAYPIMYYRGDVNDNNVIFANQCWKTVRTTDTGGVKLLYNGELSTNKRELTSSEYGTPVTNTGSFTYDSTDNTWNATVTSSSNVEITFNVPVAGNYQMLINGTYGSGSLLVLKDEEVATGTGGAQDTTMVFSYNYGALTTSNKIGVRLSASAEHPYVLKVKVLYEDPTLGTGCNNIGTQTRITLNINGTDTTTFGFNSTNNSLAYNGYMYGDVYTHNNGAERSGAYFGNSFTWDGTNYKLVDAVTTKNSTHHYTCNLTTAEETCTTLRYYYYGNSYVTLTGGDGIEQALTKMQTNTNDSIAKEKIDTWYASNMTSYTNKLEDTIWCNDRSMGDNNNNGWIANGGELSTYLYYGAYQRSNLASNTSTVKNQPSLACANKNDRFTVNNGNGNGALDYPVAMLTEDELVLAGGVGGMETDAYISNGSWYWSFSPHSFGTNGTSGFYMYNGIIEGYNVITAPYGFRPSVSLKPGTPVVSGTGTVEDPYVIE